MAATFSTRTAAPVMSVRAAGARRCTTSKAAQQTPAKTAFRATLRGGAAGARLAAAAAVTSGRANVAVRAATTMKGDVQSSYAGALVETCQAGNALEEVHADMETLGAYLEANPAVITFLSNPCIAETKKKEILDSLSKEASFHKFTSSFLLLLNSKGRIGLLESIIEEFEAAYCSVTDTEIATLTSAYKLENEQQFLIAKKIQELTGAKNIKLKPQVDEGLLGGFVVTYGKDGSGLIDMSVKGALDKISLDVQNMATVA